MFILEESQLLEDRIKDRTVLQVYKILRDNEASNDRQVYVDKILNVEKSQLLTQALIERHCQGSTSISQAVISSAEPRLPLEFVNKLAEDLQISIDDLAALSLVLQATLTQLFVIDNFTGPSIDAENYEKRLPIVFSRLQSSIKFGSLSNDGCDVYHLVKNPWLLRTVQVYLNLLNSLRKPRLLLDLEYLVWKQRYLNIYNVILLEPGDSLVRELRKIHDYIFDHHILNTLKENNTQLARFDTVELCCEMVQSALLRDDITFCRKVLDFAFESSGVSIEHTGVLGKRTKYQQNNVPQLVIRVSKSPDGVIANSKVLEDSNLPHDVELVDDTLLPEVSLVDEEAEKLNHDGNISTQAQVLLLTKLDVALRTEVTEESLQDELTQAYLRSIIISSNIWAVKFKALAMRSEVEKKFSRKVERSLLQMEKLIKIVTGNDDCKASTLRLKSFFAVLPSSIWNLKRKLGDISFSLGLHKNALDMFISIEYWEGVIKCYHCLQLNNKAESLIKQELKKQETPYLYCLLGDVTDDIVYYEKSWELSNKRFARAKKSIGTYFYVRKDYEQAIANYEDALAVNTSNLSILSLLAYSCLLKENYERAAQCYRTITCFDDSNFLAWNNLSKAYINLDQKERAWRTLKEAIKCNFDEWKIWENFMLVSIEIGALDDVITAWHRLLDLRSSHKDDQILHILTDAIRAKDLHELDADYKKLLRDSLKLLARLNLTTECSPRLWTCYFRLLLKEYEVFLIESNDTTTTKVEDLEFETRVTKILNALQRATPASLTVNSDWFRFPKKIEHVLDSYIDLVECFKVAVKVLGKRDDLQRQWKYCKLSVNNALQALQKQGFEVK